LRTFIHLQTTHFIQDDDEAQVQIEELWNQTKPEEKEDMAQFGANAESLLYLQECINDLQNRFYGLQLEQFQNEQRSAMSQMNAIPSISSNSIWSTTGSEYSSGINSDRDSSSPTNSMRSTSPDLKVFWPQQAKNKTELYHQLQQQQQLQQQLKMQQKHLLTPAHFQQTNPGMEHFQSNSKISQLSSNGSVLPTQVLPTQIGPIGSKSTARFVSSQSIQLNAKKMSHNSMSPKPQGKYVSPGKKMAQIQKQAAGEKPKQGPYNKVLIVGLSQEFRSLNGVLNIFRPYGDVVSARVYRPYSTLPNEITRWCPSVEVQDSFSAVVEYPTARCAKFAVGVLRERVQANRYRYLFI
jgi:hypothetical protein